MGKKVRNHLVRIQVLLTEEEREAFRREAEKEGQSLSGWLRERGMRQLEESDRKRRTIATSAGLRKFFAGCDRREKEREPDWDEHLRVMDSSRRRGRSDT